jgi:anaerobic magnesium-protoporphyrin IX monomethyl ester cyclase
MHTTLINPNLIVQRNDPFTTGIVYMPIGLAYVAGALKMADITFDVIDAFGSQPKNGRILGESMVLGMTEKDVIKKINSITNCIILYANQVANHASLIALLAALKQTHPNIPRAVLENTQAVTSYSLRAIKDQLIHAGADYLITGEAEHKIENFIKSLSLNNSNGGIKRIPGILSATFDNNTYSQASDLDMLPFPDWEKFPLDNYWNLKFAHGPLSAKRYLPILTSRGCPYPCNFCVIPETNNRRWRSRTGKNVAAELAYMKSKFKVDEFHIEDVNPTVNDTRTKELCSSIISEELDVTWKISAGTKIETIKDYKTVELMYNSGCRYISVSPESGSEKVRRLIGKQFDVDHALKIITYCKEFGIKTQACFVLGFPSEDDVDRQKSAGLLKDLVGCGLDEVALFIITPIPGSTIYKNNSIKGYQSLSNLTFTPDWRDDYQVLSKYRMSLYLKFLFWKFKKNPSLLFRQAFNFITRRFQTKMEMVPFKALAWKIIEIKSR